MRGSQDEDNGKLEKRDQVLDGTKLIWNALDEVKCGCVSLSVVCVFVKVSRCLAYDEWNDDE